MTKLTEKRLKIIQHLMEQHAAYHAGSIVITVWDLAYNINNTWAAKHFLSKKQMQDYGLPCSGRGITIQGHHLYELFRGIRNAIYKQNKIRLEQPKKGGEFLWMKVEK